MRAQQSKIPYLLLLSLSVAVVICCCCCFCLLSIEVFIMARFNSVYTIVSVCLFIGLFFALFCLISFVSVLLCLVLFQFFCLFSFFSFLAPAPALEFVFALQQLIVVHSRISFCQMSKPAYSYIVLSDRYICITYIPHLGSKPHFRSIYRRILEKL